MCEAEFLLALRSLEEDGFNLAGTPFQERLFALFDKDHDGSILLSEFLLGIAMVLAGTDEERLDLTFRAYDSDNKGHITFQELSKMFRFAWLAGMKELHRREMPDDSKSDDEMMGGDDEGGEMDQFATELADNFARRAFKALDLNHDGKLSKTEFLAFVQKDPELTVTLNGFEKKVALTFMRHRLPHDQDDDPSIA